MCGRAGERVVRPQEDAIFVSRSATTVALLAGVVAYLVVLTAGCILAFLTADPIEPNPPWADDKLPAEGLEVFRLMWWFNICQVTAFAAAVMTGAMTFRRGSHGVES